MGTSNFSQNRPGKENRQKIKEIINLEKNNPAVKEALKKEKQPTRPGDLSAVHNTHEVGTSGGDQRASDMETNASN